MNATIINFNAKPESRLRAVGLAPLSITPCFSEVCRPVKESNKPFQRFLGKGISMSLHSYSKVWVHLVWATLDREAMLSKSSAVKASAWLGDYAKEKGIRLKINYFNTDHVHALIDLPTNLCIENVMQLFKGASSHWINAQKIVRGKFSWGRGYGAFSVSESAVSEVAAYIGNQEQHHRNRSYSDELKLFVERYGLRWHDAETVETVSLLTGASSTPLKQGVPENSDSRTRLRHDC